METQNQITPTSGPTASDVLRGMGISTYDREAHRALVAEIENKRTQLEELSREFHDRAATDQWDEAKNAIHFRNKLRHDVLSNELNALQARERGMVKVMPEMVEAKRESIITRFVRNGLNGITSDERTAYGVGGDSLEGQVNASMLVGGNVTGLRISMEEQLARREIERKVLAQTRSDDASGQELVQETVVPDVIQRLAYMGGGINDACYRFMTATGNEYKLPQFDEASAMGTILGDQDTTINADDLADFTVVTFHARQATSGFIPITRDAVRDAAIDLPAFGEFQGGRRIQRRLEVEYTQDGDGAGTRALSVKEGAVDGPSNATANQLGFGDLSSLKRSVNRAYRTGMGEDGMYGANSKPGAVGWLFSDAVEGLLEGLTDQENRPLWLPSIRVGEPDTILGHPYFIAADLAIDTTLNATGDQAICFGNFGYFGKRQVTEYEVFRFQDSQTMAKNSIWLLVLTRTDFRPMGAIVGGKTEAVKWLLNK